VSAYAVTSGFPSAETYGLTNQLRRAAVSVPANIAEGQGRTSPREFAHHLSIALGSLCEVETHLLIAQRLAYLDAPVLDPILTQAAEVGRLLNGLIRTLSRQ
jgi:four helix bundle protein